MKTRCSACTVWRRRRSVPLNIMKKIKSYCVDFARFHTHCRRVPPPPRPHHRYNNDKGAVIFFFVRTIRRVSRGGHYITNGREVVVVVLRHIVYDVILLGRWWWWGGGCSSSVVVCAEFRWGRKKITRTGRGEFFSSFLLHKFLSWRLLIFCDILQTKNRKKKKKGKKHSEENLLQSELSISVLFLLTKKKNRYLIVP